MSKVTFSRSRARCFAAVQLAALCLAAGGASAANDAANEVGSFDVTIENDRVAETDRHYTNGIRLSYLSPPGGGPEVLRDFAEWLPLFPPDGRMHVGYTLGQSMFTPNDTGSREVDPGDRPYAGWLYGGVALVSEGTNQLQTIELDLGVVGPYAFAEEAQNTWHHIIRVNDAHGWEHQLDNEPGAVLFYEHKWRVPLEDPGSGLGADLTPHASGALGNVLTYAAAGATLRFGEDLANDYGPPRIRPAVPGSTLLRPHDVLGWYIFAGIEGRAVLRNIFLDGNTFSDSHSVNKNVLVGDVQVGAAIILGPVRLAYTHVFRTKEFTEQDDPDRFGAVSLSVAF